MSTTPRVAKKFQIEVVKDREITETVAEMQKSELSGHVSMVTKTQKRVVPESYYVYFPGGHSIWCETKADLQRLGLMEADNSEIDLDTGLPVEPPREIDLKEVVQRRTRERSVR